MNYTIPFSPIDSLSQLSPSKILLAPHFPIKLEKAVFRFVGNLKTSLTDYISLQICLCISIVHRFIFLEGFWSLLDNQHSNILAKCCGIPKTLHLPKMLQFHLSSREYNIQSECWISKQEP